MPAMLMRCDTSRAHSSRCEKCSPTSSTPLPRARACSRCSRPSMRVAMEAMRRSLAIQPSANSTSIWPMSRRLASTSALRSAASSSGKQSAILAAAMRRRAEGMRTTSAPMQRPSQRIAAGGKRAISQITAAPSHAGQWRGASRARVKSGRGMPGIDGIVAGCPRSGLPRRLSLYSRVARKDPPLRLLYTLAMFLATPLLVLRLLARGLRSRPYHRRWPERFGFFKAPDIRGSLWVHAVSVGEVNAAEPLIKALQRDYPEAPLVITTVTPTGTARVQQLFGDSVFHVYLPYDLPFAVRRFMNRIRPRLALIVETEIWPNLYFACRRRGVPLMIVNARLSERSMRGYKPMRSLLRSALRCVDRIAAQSRTDAARY